VSVVERTWHGSEVYNPPNLSAYVCTDYKHEITATENGKPINICNSPPHSKFLVLNMGLLSPAVNNRRAAARLQSLAPQPGVHGKGLGDRV
jgi:hypothetical protein